MSGTYQFGPFLVDTSSYRLMHGAQPVPLSPRAFDLLILFADRPSALLPKRKILSILWKDVAVTDNALTSAL